VEVLFVENAPGFGGSLTGILHLVDAFPAWIQPTLITAFDPKPFVEVPSRLRVEVVPIDLTRTNFREGDSFAKTLYRFGRFNVWPWARQVAKICRKYRVDLIHGNNLLLGNMGAAVAGWRLGIPVISHQKGYEHNGRLVRTVINRKWYTHHIATSHSIADHLLSLGVPPERCSMIYDAIIPPPESLVRRENPEPVIAMHSVLRESKGHEVFLRAVAEVAKETRQPFRVVIAGAPPQASAYPEQLKKLADDLGLSDRVTFTGHLRDPFDLLAGVDISVHASVEPEPFGRVAAESMIMGVPVIAAAGSGAGEYVEAAKAGMTTPPRDVHALASALKRLLESRERRQELGERGRDFAQREFAPRAIASQLVELYEDIIAKRMPRQTLAQPEVISLRPEPAMARNRA
jgi:glycosyltransferase involved in cell wall biosynthesis